LISTTNRGSENRLNRIISTRVLIAIFISQKSA